MFQQIVATLVATPEGQRAIQQAMHLAEESKAKLHLVAVAKHHSVTEAFASLNGPAVARMVEDDRLHSVEGEQERALEDARGRGISVTVQNVDDDVVDSILAVLRERAADLLVLGLPQDGSSIGRIWSKVGDLADKTPCCVLGVP